jgi:succinyl-CoA synthetase beta subunit
MNIHEYQGKALLKGFGVAIQEGIIAETPEQAVEAAKELQKQTGTGWWVVKSQIHAGGRGKGKIVGSEQNGVALAKSLDAVKTISTNILGKNLVTLQTSDKGKKVSKVLIAQDVYYPGVIGSFKGTQHHYVFNRRRNGYRNRCSQYPSFNF